MSTSRGCIIVRWTNKKWYCIIAREEYDYDFDDFDIYGPCNTEAEAWDSHNSSNPGGGHVIKCKAQKDLGGHLAKALRKYIKNGNRMPSFKAETVIRHRRAW